MDNDGKQIQQEQGKKRSCKAVLIIVIILVLAVTAGYIGLCSFAGKSGRYLPHTTLAGVDVSGLTQVEASSRLDAQLDQLLDGRSVEFTCDGKQYAVPLRDFTVDTDSAAQDAMAAQSSSFFARGAKYLSALLGHSDFHADVSLEQTPDAVNQAIEECADPDAQTTWAQESDAIVFEKGRTGRTLNIEQLEASLVEQAGLLLSGGEPAVSAPIEAELATAPPQDPDFEAIYQEVFVAPADAYLNVETKEIVPSVTGVSFDISAARTALENTAEGGRCSVPLKFEEPELTTELLSAKLFADVLGASTTKCAGPSTRWYNISLACSRVDGTILLPGEVFSYNKHCGPYSESGGYKKAGAYVGGKNIDTTAGGICQLSSTIYWTTLKANLQIVERNQHRYNSGYMPVVGTDATVFSDSLDFRFKNNTEYPIKLSCYQDSGHTLHVTIYGTDTTGIHGEPYSVTLSTVPYKNVYKPDASKVPVGGKPVRDEEYARYNGITVEVYQKLVDKNGKTVSTTYLYKNTYRSSDAVYYYNPADAARLGIDTSTGLMTLTPVIAPTPIPSAEPSPAPTPSTAPAPTPDVTSTPAPTPDVTLVPDPTPVPTPVTSPETESSPAPSAAAAEGG